MQYTVDINDYSAYPDNFNKCLELYGKVINKCLLQITGLFVTK